MLTLNKGEAIALIVSHLSRLGYRWAYRVVDSRSFGLPQRRRRVIILASLSSDPRNVLFADEARPSKLREETVSSFGFYWTEGNTGLGWAENAIPTLKGGSSLGIPSPPAIWIPRKGVFTPTIQDAERLQGFPRGWTDAVAPSENRLRWKLIGNAVSVPVAKWLGDRLRNPGSYDSTSDELFIPGASGWPIAAWSDGQSIFKAKKTTEWPVSTRWKPLTEFLIDRPIPLSCPAASGFLKRARASRLRFHDEFLDDLALYLEKRGSIPASSSIRPSSETARARLRSVPQRNTGPEIALRSTLHRLGMRFRIHARPEVSVRTTADVVFKKAKVAIFIDGCFWHGCNQHGTWPKANAVWWKRKIKGNMARDQRNRSALIESGWTVIQIWEHDSISKACKQVVMAVQKKLWRQNGQS